MEKIDKKFKSERLKNNLLGLVGVCLPTLAINVYAFSNTYGDSFSGLFIPGTIASSLASLDCLYGVCRSF